MGDPYPPEQRRFGGEVIAEGVRASGSPIDPEADARGGGLGTGDVDPATGQSQATEGEPRREGPQPEVDDGGTDPNRS